MEQIQYFGAKSKDGKVLSGDLAKAWSNIFNKKDMLAGHGIQMPYIEILSSEEILEANSKSFVWPVRFWVSLNDEINVSEQVAKSLSEFRDKLHPYKDQNISVVMTKLPVSNGQKQVSSSMFFGSDFIFTKVGSAQIPLSINSKQFFDKVGLDKSMIYKFSIFNGIWYLDAIFKRNEYIEDLIGKDITEIDDETFENFKLGFFSGFNYNETSHISYICNQVQFLKVGFSKISKEYAKYQGFLLGRYLGQEKNKILSFTDHNSEDILSALLADGNDSLVSYNNISTIYNSIVKKDIDSFIKGLSELYVNSKKFGSKGPHYFTAILHLNNYICNDCTSGGADYSAKFANDYVGYSVEMPSLNKKFTIDKSMDISGMKFRVLSKQDAETNKYEVRIQIESLLKKQKINFEDGTKLETNSVAKSGIEINAALPFTTLQQQHFEKIKYTELSNAGTSKKYAKIELKGDDVVISEDDSFFCTKQDLMSYLGNYGYV